jgi:hypothetical protein
MLTVLGAIEPAAGGKPPAAPADLERGVREVRERRYTEAAATLEEVLRRLSAQKAAARADLVKANVYLGVAHLALGNPDSAAAYLGVALDLDHHLRLHKASVPPEAIKALEALKRERAREHPAERAPSAPRKGGGFGKAALIGGGAAAVAAGALVVSKGGSEASEPGLVINSFVFASPSAVCVETGALFNMPVVLSADITAGSNAVGISGGSVTLFGMGAEVINPTALTPTRLEAGERRVLRVETRFTCRNLPDDAPRAEQWRGRLKIGAPGFPTAETQNVLQIDYP